MKVHQEVPSTVLYRFFLDAAEQHPIQKRKCFDSQFYLNFVLGIYNQVWPVCGRDNSNVLKRRNAIKLSKELAENAGTPTFAVPVSFTSDKTVNFILKNRDKCFVRLF